MGTVDSRFYSTDPVSPYVNQRPRVPSVDDRALNRKKNVRFNPEPNVSRLPSEDEHRCIQSLINCVNACRRCCQLFPSLCSAHIYKGHALTALLQAREGHVYSYKSDHEEEVEIFSCYAWARAYLNHVATIRPLLLPSSFADPPHIQPDNVVRRCSRPFVRKPVYIDEMQNHLECREWRPRTQYWTHHQIQQTQRWSAVRKPESVHLRSHLRP
jgi:hypothetical protein